MKNPLRLFERVRKAAVDERTEARRTYVEILQRADSPQRGDDQALLRTMAVLGIDADWLEHDREVLQQAAQLEAEAAAGTAELDAKIEAAGKAWTDHQAETKKIIQERRETENKLQATFTDLQHQRARAHEAAGKLGLLRRKHWQLFGVEPSQPEPLPQLAQTGGAPGQEAASVLVENAKWQPARWCAPKVTETGIIYGPGEPAAAEAAASEQPHGTAASV